MPFVVQTIIDANTNMYDALSSERAVQELVTNNPSLAEKVRAHIKKVIGDIKAMLKVAKNRKSYGEIGAMEKDLAQLEKIDNAFFDAMNKTKETENGTRNTLQSAKQTAPLAEEPIISGRQIVAPTERGNTSSTASGSPSPRGESKNGRQGEAETENGGKIKYSLERNAEAEVDKLLDDKYYRNEVLLDEHTAKILTIQDGVRDLPLVMNASHIRENILTEAEAKAKGLKVNKNIHYHGLGKELFLKVIDNLDSITEAYRGTKNAADTSRRENYFILMSQFKVSDRNLINVPVYINQKAMYNEAKIDANKVSTVFGRENLRKYIQKEVQAGNLVRIKMKGTESIGGTSLINAAHKLDTLSDVNISPKTTNVKENLKKSEKFSVKRNVEEVNDLIAVHNLSVENANKSLDLGGLPMASIAVLKAQNGHNEYGDISLVFGKDSIDPQMSNDNKIYGGDAWTPTYPSIDYKASEKVTDRIKSKYYELNKKFHNNEARPLYNYIYDAETKLKDANGEAGLKEKLYNDTDMMQVYRLDSGKDKIADVEKITTYPMSDEDKKFSAYLVKALGKDAFNSEIFESNETGSEYPSYEYANDNLDTLKNIEAEYFRLLGYSDDKINYIINKMNAFHYQRVLNKAYRYLYKNATNAIIEKDNRATWDKIISETNQADYKKWVDDLFTGIEKKSGIYNGKDKYESYGVRASFETLHWENSLENIVNVMKQEINGPGVLYGDYAIWGVSQKEYGSIDEVKADENRLKMLSGEEYSNIKQAFKDRLTEIAKSIRNKNELDQHHALNNAMGNIIEAVRQEKTKTGIKNYLLQFHKNVTDNTVNDIVSLVSDIANMPAQYFEAKPQRVLKLNEIKYAVVLEGAKALQKRLEEFGIKYVTYEYGNTESRTKALNDEAERINVKFSEKRDTEYLEAVKSGENEKAQMMVDEAAKEAGYTLKAYHGSETGGFTVFNKAGFDGVRFNAIFLTPSKDLAETYSGKDGQIYDCYVNESNLLTIEGNGDPNSVIDIPAELKKQFSIFGDRMKTASTNELAEAAQRAGYDGVYFKNIKDLGQNRDRSKDLSGDNIRDVIAVFNSEQVKSSETATYDNDGNVIPLSERFKNDNPDIRYSIKRDVNGKDYVEVESNDIYNDNISEVSIIAGIISSKWKNLIHANGQDIRVNAKTNRHWRFSREAKQLYNQNPEIYKDKIKAFNNADELLISAKQWINEKPKHNNFDNYGRGKINYKVGKNGYEADIIVGINGDGSATLYDIVNIKRKQIAEDRHIDVENNFPLRGETSAVQADNIIATAKSQEKNSEKRDISEYSYAKLTAKPDMKLTILSKRATILNNWNVDRIDLINKAIENVIEVGGVNENKNAYVHVDDTETDVIVSKASLKHGLDRRTGSQSKVYPHIGEILKNSIKINELSPKSEEASNSYILIGAAKGDNNRLTAIKFVVNKFTNNVESVDVLKSIDAKTEPAVLSTTASGKALQSVPGSTLKISDLLEFVKNNLQSVLPQDVLQHYGLERGNSEIEKGLLYSEKRDDPSDIRALIDTSSLVESLTKLNATGTNSISKTRLSTNELSINKVNKVAKWLLDSVQSTMSKDKLNERLQTLYDYILHYFFGFYYIYPINEISANADMK